MPLPSEMLGPEDIDRLRKMFESPEKKEPKPGSRIRAMICPVVSEQSYNIRSSQINSSLVQYDVSYLGMTPMVSNKFPSAVAMSSNILNIGKGSHNDVDLEKFGQCNFLSSKHAVVFYDDESKSYELLNYSPYGTYVNNEFLSIDPLVVSKAQKTNNKSCTELMQILENKVVNLINKKAMVYRNRTCSFDLNMDGSKKLECCCSTKESKYGYEGSALLNRGTLLIFGCIPFVFSIID